MKGKGVNFRKNKRPPLLSKSEKVRRKIICLKALELVMSVSAVESRN
jgi:hypothetical protein